MVLQKPSQYAISVKHVCALIVVGKRNVVTDGVFCQAYSAVLLLL